MRVMLSSGFEHIKSTTMSGDIKPKIDNKRGDTKMTTNEIILDTIKTSAKRTPKYYMQLINLGYQLYGGDSYKRWEVASKNNMFSVCYCKEKGETFIRDYYRGYSRRRIVEHNDNFRKIDFVKMLNEDIKTARLESTKYLINPTTEYYYSIKCDDGTTMFSYIYGDTRLYNIKREPDGRTIHKFRKYDYEPLESIRDMKSVLKHKKYYTNRISEHEQTIEHLYREIERYKGKIVEAQEDVTEYGKEAVDILSDVRQLRESRKAKVS